MQTNQTPEELAEEIMRAASAFAAAKLALYGRQDPSFGNPADLLYDLKFAVNRLREMVASGVKDAERWNALTEQRLDDFLEDYEMVGESEDGRDACYHPTDGERFLIKDAVMGFLADADAAIAATKRGEA